MDKLPLVYQKRLVIFAKAPRLGDVKTRLAKDIGYTRATGWYRSTLQKVTRRLARDTRWATVVALSPDRLAGDGQSVFKGLLCIPQGKGDLGARMGRVFKRFPPGPVVVIGSDIPGIEPYHIWQAFKALGRTDAVFGPSADGGYWLVGVKRRRSTPELFRNVRWSTEHALEDTLANITGCKVAFVETLYDVDTGDDLV